VCVLVNPLAENDNGRLYCVSSPAIRLLPEGLLRNCEVVQQGI
jgi:hypothetical protein